MGVRAAIEHLAALVAFDTVSNKSNLAIIDHIEKFLAPMGYACQRLPNSNGNKASLMATLPAANGETHLDGFIFSGHTDVVPVEGQPWDTDPFTLTLKGELVFGRGTCDMKGFLACLLAQAPLWAANRPTRPITLAFTYDEEIGCLSAPELGQYAWAAGFRPQLFVVGEPTMMEVVDAHKGIRSYETTVIGLEAHSSNTHLGVNAVAIASELVVGLNELAEKYRTIGDSSGRFSPPFSTIHVGVMHGGTARNIIPRECKFLWEIRPLPQHNPDEILEEFNIYVERALKKMHAVDATTSITTTPVTVVYDLKPDASMAALPRALHCAGSNATHAVSYGTEGGIFQRAGFPVIICGPGSIEQAHKPNEFVAVAQLAQCLDFLHTLTSS